MLHREFLPPEALRDSIKCFWHNSRDFGAAPSSFEVLPDGYAEIIFYFGHGCGISLGGSEQPLPPLFMMGLLNQPVHLHTSGRFEVIGVRCFPWTVFDLLGLPSGQEALRIFEHPMAQLHPRLAQSMQAGRVDEALAELTRYLLHARAQVAVDSMLARAGLAMRQAHGSMPVSQVAAAAHATVRTLERKFRQSSGHTVKDVSGLMRFEQVRNRLWLQPDAGLAGLAQELGYTDQSHLSREFKRYGGMTPSAFARKARQGQQAAGSDIVAFVQA
jgi:AraC-like DNA-binding protein